MSGRSCRTTAPLEVRSVAAEADARIVPAKPALSTIRAGRGEMLAAVVALEYAAVHRGDLFPAQPGTERPSQRVMQRHGGAAPIDVHCLSRDPG